MTTPSVTHLILILQTAISPTILISAVSLLLLTMTNRLGRVIDRARSLDAQLPRAAADDRERIVEQLRILWRRARLIRLSIILASVSALAAAVLIMVLFLTTLGLLDSAWLIGGLFILSMASLVSSLIAFIRDVDQTLAALKHELSGSLIDED
jgi:hypothetical protein